MKKELLAVSVGSVLLLSSCGGVDKETTKTNEAETKNVAAQVVENVTSNVVPTASANYTPYSDSKVAAATGDIVLFFKAEWCPGCQASHKALMKDTIRDDLTVLEVDYDQSADLQEKYGVTSQHTFVQIDSDGNMIKKWMGSKNVADIETKLAEKEMVKDTMKEEKMTDDKEKVMKDEKMMDDKKEMMKDDMKSHNDSMKKEEKMMDDKKEMVDTPVATTPGMYGVYSAEKVANAAGDIVLFFKANWCPSCQALDKKLSGTTIPEGLTVLKVDYDNSADLQEKYEVRSQHTFVQIDSNGNMIKKWMGGSSLADIEGKIK